MRIARILTRLNLGGPARQALASDPLLRARGHEVRVFAGTPGSGEGDLFDAFRERGLDVVRVPALARSVSVLRDARALWKMRAALKEFAPDVVHTHASKAGLIGRSAARALHHAALVHTFHGHVLDGYFGKAVSKGIAVLERQLAHGTDRIVAVSHATADDLLRHAIVADPRRLVVVPPGVDLDRLLAIAGREGSLRNEIGARAEDVVVGVVGRLAPVKRPELAVDVFAMLALRHAHLRLVFIGDGEERGTVEARIAALPAEQRARVRLIGAKTDMPPVLADLDIVLLTSRNEGAPIALIEAGAAARPAVAMDVGGVGEIVVHERTGYLGTNVDELAYWLAELIASPTARTAMGQRARVRVGSRHSAEALARRLEDLYRVVVEERACAS